MSNGLGSERKHQLTSPVVVSATTQPQTAKPVDRSWLVAATVFSALGLAICAVAAVDFVLAWTPFRFGNGEWEFGTVTRTMDSLALGTTGVVLLVVSAAVQRLRLALALLGVLAVLAVVGLIGCLVLYGLTVPVALKAVPAEASSVLKRAVVRTSSFGLIYLVLYSWLGWFTWRARRAISRGLG
jgi:hypothetical protein